MEQSIGMTFGAALEELKAGKKIARDGWNGKGMWLNLVRKGHFDIGVDTVGGIGNEIVPWIGIKTAKNTFGPWVASQCDMLASDWVVVD